jgi:hypothetical protein
LSVFNDPNLAAVTLAAAKIMAGAQPTSVGPAATPHVETTAPAAQKPEVDVDPATEQMLHDKLGPAYVERWKAELRDQQEGQ